MARPPESSIVSKCALVIDILTRTRQSLTFSDISEQSGFAKSSCHRILSVLQSESLVEYDKSSRTYQTGPRLQLWSRSAWRRIDLQQAAAEIMTALRDEVQMNVALSVLDGDSILYLRTAQVEAVRYGAHSGDHAPLHCTAAGKIFLANLSGNRQQTVLNALTLEKFTEHTKTTLADLIPELHDIRKSGYAVARGEEFLPVTGSAVPIWNAQNEVTAALSLWAMNSSAPAEQVMAQRAKLAKAAHEISIQLGWAPL